MRAWIKQHKILSAFLVILLLSYFWYAPPFKVTDPSNPLFVESWFRLRDYGSAQGVQELRDKVLPKLFPEGTAKEYVDLMMVTRGGAHIIDQSMYDEGAYVYRFKPLYLFLTPDDFNIHFYFQDDKVRAIHFAGKMTVGDGYRPTKIPGGLRLHHQGDRK